jgi:hypothetical protein
LDQQSWAAVPVGSVVELLLGPVAGPMVGPLVQPADGADVGPLVGLVVSR